jgi:hypothetical protein
VVLACFAGALIQVSTRPMERATDAAVKEGAGADSNGDRDQDTGAHSTLNQNQLSNAFFPAYSLWQPFPFV